MAGPRPREPADFDVMLGSVALGLRPCSENSSVNPPTLLEVLPRCAYRTRLPETLCSRSPQMTTPWVGGMAGSILMISIARSRSPISNRLQSGKMATAQKLRVSPRCYPLSISSMIHRFFASDHVSCDQATQRHVRGLHAEALASRHDLD